MRDMFVCLSACLSVCWLAEWLSDWLASCTWLSIIPSVCLLVVVLNEQGYKMDVPNIVFERGHQLIQYTIKIYNGLLTVRWAGRCCGHGGCYPSVSCACYGSHIKISKLSILDSIPKYRKNIVFSCSWTELQGQINNHTSAPWKKNNDNFNLN